MSNVFCPACGAQNMPGSRFCCSCGSPIPEQKTAPNLCPQCGSEVMPGAPYCSACGMNLTEPPAAAPAKPAPTEPEQPSKRAKIMEKLIGQKVVKETEDGVVGEDGVTYVSADEFFANQFQKQQAAAPGPVPQQNPVPPTAPPVGTQGQGGQPAPGPMPGAQPNPVPPAGFPGQPVPGPAHVEQPNPVPPTTPPAGFPGQPAPGPAHVEQPNPVPPTTPPAGFPGPVPGAQPNPVPPTGGAQAPSPQERPAWAGGPENPVPPMNGGFPPAGGQQPQQTPQWAPPPPPQAPQWAPAPPPAGGQQQAAPQWGQAPGGWDVQQQTTPQWAAPQDQRPVWGADTQGWAANGVPNGWQAPAAPDGQGADNYDDEDEEEDRISPMDYLAQRNSEKGIAKQRPGKKAQDEDAKKKKKKFDALVNGDGYYDDRKPVDDDEVYDTGRHVQWIPLVLGVVGILVFAVIAIQVQGLL